MTGEKSSYTSSVVTKATEPMQFPYSDVVAWLGVGCNSENKWSYIGFSTSPNITDDETEDGYNIIKTRVRWDKNVENIMLTQEWGSKFLHFSNDEQIIDNFKKYNTFLIELNWYGEGNVYFNFSLSGSTKAISKMESNCSRY
ncbi:MAG: hypothetical protein O2900_16395 [Proteobacteria bacterium]|nr:hypothetical protein [Pseudomonadota bacterium]